MLRMNIPTIGTKIELTEPWTFNVYAEHRNRTLGEYLNIMVPDNHIRNRDEWPIPPNCPPNISHWEMEKYPILQHTFGAGTQLIVDRIFIRKDMPDFDSLTFIIPKKTIGRTKNVRFWAKLTDVNNIYYKVIM